MSLDSQRACRPHGPGDAFRRETFALPRVAAREKARELFRRFPKTAYMTEIESWRVFATGAALHAACPAPFDGPQGRAPRFSPLPSGLPPVDVDLVVFHSKYLI